MTTGDYLKNIQSMSSNIVTAKVTPTINATTAAKALITNSITTNSLKSKSHQEVREREHEHYKKKNKEGVSALSTPNTLTSNISPHRAVQEAPTIGHTTDTAYTTNIVPPQPRLLLEDQEEVRPLQSSFLCRFSYEGKGKAWCLVQCDGNHFRRL